MGVHRQPAQILGGSSDEAAGTDDKAVRGVLCRITSSSQWREAAADSKRHRNDHEAAVDGLREMAGECSSEEGTGGSSEEGSDEDDES